MQYETTASELFDLLLSTLIGRKALEADQDVLRKPGKGAADTAELNELKATIEVIGACVQSKSVSQLRAAALSEIIMADGNCS